MGRDGHSSRHLWLGSQQGFLTLRGHSKRRRGRRCFQQLIAKCAEVKNGAAAARVAPCTYLGA